MIDLRSLHEQLFELSPVGLLLLRRDGSIAASNLTACDLLDQDRCELLDRYLSDLLHQDDRDLFFRLFRGRWEESGSISVETSMRIGKQDYRSFRLDYRALTLQQDARFFLVSLTDISTRTLQQQRDKTFFAIASHELRTPINNISLAIELLGRALDGQADEQSASYMEIAMRGVKRLQLLTEQIGQLRDALTPPPAKLGQADLVELTAEAVAIHQLQAQARGMQLRMHSPQSHLYLQTDAGQVMQVLGNLLTNAIRYSVEGDTIEVHLEHISPLARCTISDHGPGIPEAIRNDIFKPFVQGDPSIESPDARQGSGLGLSICHSIIELLGGRIDFESTPEQTRFWFELPCR